MKIPQIFQKLIALVAVVALSFGFAAPSASAAYLFNAPLGATFNVQYIADTEVGITVHNAISHKTVLWCNNYYNKGASIEWKSSCTSEQALDSSESYVVQGFSKSTGPNSRICWEQVQMLLNQALPPTPENNRYISPSLIPGSNRYVIAMISSAGNPLAQMTFDGLNLGFKGETKPNLKQIPNRCP
jgi:hypothetical protein